jgi:3-deoxy-D-manno-octulosonic-acid transferase
VINARLSERSFLRYQKVQWVFDLLAKNISQLLCQTKEDADRFEKLGVDSSKIQVTGSIKFDINISAEILEKGKRLKDQLGSQRSIWIAASTHQGEDEQIIAAHKQLLKKDPTALLILVPRHPERFNDVFKLIQTHKLNAVKRTTKENTTAKTQVYLADTMGEMLLLIQSADICFMGGSLIGDKVGGHNLLEPAALSKPCLTGPSFFNFTLITQQLIDNHACTICHDSSEIFEQLISLFSSSAEIKKQGKNALDVVNKNKGAIMKTLSYLKCG